MTDERDDNDFPLQPFPTRADSPFPPLAESLPPPRPADPPSDWIQNADAHDLPTRENTLVALGRFAFPPAPPLDDEGVAARDRRWGSRTILVTAAFLLVFNAVSPLNWSRQQAPGWVQETVQSLSEVWVAQLAVFGVDMPRQGLRQTWKTARDARFIGQDPAPTAD
ncbi:MAG: hypothetical protein Q8R45_04790 [Brevundimonas sp.]|uniref:hypothetical protein n=1 Tax=Brevundimonas sp. TaxID=1871086 RepID=UPI002720AADB|nr:hypothetical protein [Brevundimonas sp.]MDO9589166.1 hypothetical protein [Brevundimonas sp.]MDP3369821.1 hypothetical protein [Brevundimonas sp.]MDP3656268.1 hypothetical protein [Brevundimonas sp.]MDZ4112686.1 hypothetical protein [Brevundimonas sp.]